MKLVVVTETRVWETLVEDDLSGLDLESHIDLLMADASPTYQDVEVEEIA